MSPRKSDGQPEATIAHLELASGVRLYYEWWRPAHPKALLLIVHGVGEHSGRYGPLVRYFYERNIAVALFDQRGHGQSSGTRGHFDHLQDLLGDLAAFIQHTQAAHPHIPMFLVGHSFGGQVVLNFVVRYAKGLRGLILSSPNIALRTPIPKWKRVLSEIGDRWVPRLSYQQAVNPEWLSHDPAIVQAYATDPRVIRRFSIHAALEIVRNLDIVMALASRIHLPSLFLHAGADTICDPEATRQFYRRIPVSRKRLKVYSGMYHELFNEVGQEQVFGDIVQWLDEILADEQALEMHRGALRLAKPVAWPNEHKGGAWIGTAS
jgi:alpha-beta hydrolase superfamily lysophospholipase